VLKHLHKLQDIPQKLREKIFEKLFNQAEIAKLDPEAMKNYDESLKIHPDCSPPYLRCRNDSARTGTLLYVQRSLLNIK
jgi:hypothetical protein